MKNLVKASLLVMALSFIHTQAFAGINCEFKDNAIPGIKSIEMTEEALVLNDKLEIALEKSTIRCGLAGRRDRYEGAENGYQVILKDCSSSDHLEGHLIDSVNQQVGDIACK